MTMTNPNCSALGYKHSKGRMNQASKFFRSSMTASPLRPLILGIRRNKSDPVTPPATPP